MGDHFSKQAAAYAKYRPTYPEELFEFVLGLVFGASLHSVWDCATGNGQAAVRLAKYVTRVEATDISSSQIENAVPAPNIHYQVCKAEETPFGNGTFDLVTVAQAIHWFDHGRFYEEVRRVAKPGAHLAVWGYVGCEVDEKVDKVYDHYYHGITGPYWPKERAIVETRYLDLPFPFKEIPTPEFAIRLDWDMEDFLGYLRTWSATQRYINKKNENPLDLIREKILAAWGDPLEKKEVVWPIIMKVGKIQ